MIGIIIPLKKEAQFLIQSLKQCEVKTVHNRKFYCGFFENVSVVICVCGVGKTLSAAATQQMIDLFECVELYHFGSSGAISSHLKIGDCIVAQTAVEHDSVTLFGSSFSDRAFRASSDEKLVSSFLAFTPTQNKVLCDAKVFCGTVISGNEDIVHVSRREELFQKFSALSVDWESFSVLKVANSAGIPVLGLRLISDLAHESTNDEFKMNIEKISEIGGKLLYRFIASRK